MLSNRVAKFLFLLLAAIGIIGIVTCSSDTVSSRSYKGHESDKDMNNFVNTYKNTVGTRLDDCQTCHKGAVLTTTTGGLVNKNQCDYCHLIRWPDSTLVNPPTTYVDTLNLYGTAYYNGGSTRAALRALDEVDSDMDGYTNKFEATGGFEGHLYYPGDALSHPEQLPAPAITLNMSEVMAMTPHSEFMVANTTQQRYDSYVTYKGVKIIDLLTSLGVNVNAPEFIGITVVSPDGFTKSITSDKVKNQYPTGLYFHGLDQATMGNDCGFVEYPNPNPMSASGPIADPQWLMLGYMRDNDEKLDKVTLEVETGKINGEGPYRLIVPQTVPGSPDRGSKYPAPSCADTYGFDSHKDHNAGEMARGVIAIRVDPLPAGYEDFDYRNGGWAYVDNSQVIVYGFMINK